MNEAAGRIRGRRKGFLTPEEAMDRHGVARSTLYDAINRERLISVRWAGDPHAYYSEAGIERALGRRLRTG